MNTKKLVFVERSISFDDWSASVLA